MFDKQMDREEAQPYLYPPTLDSVNSSCTLPPPWSLRPDAPCRPWLPDLLRRGWRIGPPRRIPPYYTARRTFGSPLAILIAALVSAFIALLEGLGGAGVGSVLSALILCMLAYVGGRVLFIVATKPSDQMRAAIPEVLQTFARDSQEFIPPRNAIEAQMLNAAAEAIRHIAASPAWRSPMVRAWNRQLELNLINEWSEVRYRVGRICEIRKGIVEAAHMPISTRQDLEEQISAILRATDSRVKALLDYSNSLRRVEVCLQSFHDAHTGERLRAELGDLLAETAGDTFLAEGTRHELLDLTAAQAGLEAALNAMSEQAEFLRTGTRT